MKSFHSNPARLTIRDLSRYLLSPSSHRSCIHLPKHQHQQRSLPQSTNRHLSTSTSLLQPRPIPQSKPSSSSKPTTPTSLPHTTDRGPASTEDTQTDFSALNVLGNTPAPSTSIDACSWDGFHLNSGVKIVGGSGVLLVGGEAFAWMPWVARQGEGGRRLVNEKGQWDVEDEAWGLLGVVWPKPDLLILGLGKDMRPISPRTRQFINGLGIRVEIQDTRNAAAQFNLLATERGVGSVAAALIPMGWREGVGIKSSGM